MTERNVSATLSGLLLANAVSLAFAPGAMAQEVPRPGEDGRLDALQRQLDAQTRTLEGLRGSLAEQERSVADLQRALDEERLRIARGRGAAPDPWLAPWGPVAAQGAAPVVAAQDPDPRRPAGEPVGRPPEQSLRPPEIAQIFEQPGVLTRRGGFVLEPSLQYGYASNDRVALIGYTVIPAILIGLIDVRQVKTTTGLATLTGRYGLTNRLELEARVPYVHVSTDTVSREIFTGSAQDKVFNSDGKGLGDVELTARYQINRGGPDQAFWVGWLRYKSRTGKDPFEVVTDCVTRCVSNATGTGLPLEVPTGSGFTAIQPGITWLYPSDPVVFFGSFSWLHNFEREDVSRTVLTGAPEGFPQTTTEFMGDVKAGDIFGVNVGMGLALNEKASISIGYDQSVVDKLKQNGEDAPGAVRITMGTLLLGASYRFSDKYMLSLALGVGVTRDSPDVTLTARLPITF